MKKTKILVIALIVSAGLNLVALGVVIRGVWLWKEADRLPTRPRFEQRLHLTQEQQEKMRARRAEMAGGMDSIRVELDAKRSEILKLLKQTEVDTVSRNKLFKEIANLQMQLELKMFEHAVAVRNMLTPEQRNVLFQPMEERFREWGSPFEPGPGPSPGDENRPRTRMHHSQQDFNRR